MQRTSKPQTSDLRFIPAEDKYRKIKYALDDDSSNRSLYGRELAGAFWGNDINNTDTRILHGMPHKPYLANQTENKPKHIIEVEEIKLDTSLDIDNDFYNNPLSWSKNGSIYIGAGCDLFSYKFTHINRIYSFAQTDHIITSVTTSDNWILFSAFDEKSRLLLIDAVTTNNFSLKAHAARIGILRSDISNPKLFYAGNYWGELARIDLRDHNPVNYFNVNADENEICGMSISNDTIATGTNDNNVHIWDKKKMDAPVWSHSNHKSAVKALAFSPFNYSLLASAGGNADKTIQIWDTSKQQLVTTNNTESQTCNLHWMTNHTLFTTHGAGAVIPSGNTRDFTSAHMLKTWNLQSSKLEMVKSAQCVNERILFSAQNPNNSLQFFTASSTSKLALVEARDDLEENPGRLSIHNKGNMIR